MLQSLVNYNKVLKLGIIIKNISWGNIPNITLDRKIKVQEVIDIGL